MSDIHGLYVGQLDRDELAWFEAEVAAGRAWRDYNHAGGAFGIAKVSLAIHLHHKNGAPMFAPDGTMLDDKGNRSIFDDIDR